MRAANLYVRQVLQRTISSISWLLLNAYVTCAGSGARGTTAGSSLSGDTEPRLRRRFRHSSFVTGVYAPKICTSCAGAAAKRRWLFASVAGCSASLLGLRLPVLPAEHMYGSA